MNRFVMSGSVGVRRRRPAKAESEKRTGQARRRRFIKVAQEKRLGLPRRKRDCPPEEMGVIVTDESARPLFGPHAAKKCLRN